MFAIYNRDKIRARCLIRFSTRLVVGDGAPIITSFRRFGMRDRIYLVIYIYTLYRYGLAGTHTRRVYTGNNTIVVDRLDTIQFGLFFFFTQRTRLPYQWSYR